MANPLGTITLIGRSGSSYQFNIWGRSTKFNPAAAVYVQSKVASNGKYDIIYVGQTGDLSQRPLDHHKTECFDRHGADKLLIRAEGNEQTRLNIETDLIQGYRPPCNG